jgi:serine/threonine protein kinase
MEGAASPSLEATLLQRWFPLSPDGTSTRGQDESFSETDLRDISDVLRRVGQGGWSRIPRIYAVLRLLGRLDVIDLFLAQAISDVYFPFTHNTLPQSLNPSVANGFLQLQRAVLSSALDLERETGRHRHFSSANDVPFIKVEELGKGAYGYVDRVVSTISHKEYARKLILRGRTFQRDRKILRDFERELGTLKKLRHHRHIVQLVGSYTDPRYVGILMSPVAECDLKEFLHNCTSESSGQHSRRSFMRSFFGCLTSALSYLHDNTVRHKDIKPQNILVSQHTVYLTDFGISLDWSEIGQSTTTGPTPKTARYCAPEVSDYAPRNTSSDMWSLGCIFLEIWTVLKGESVTKLHAFLETHGERSSCYHLNNDATSDWIKMLESKPTLADNPPQAWIQHLLVEDKQKRWTARHLLSEIESINNDPDTKFAFSGQCCLEELESAESVVSSHGSIGEATARDSEAQLPPPAVSLSANTLGNSAGGMPLEGSAISRGLDQDDQNKEVHGPGTVDSVIKVTPPNGSDGITSIPPAVESELDSTTLTEKSIISPVASWLALQNASKEEEGVLIAMGESPEKGPHTALSHKNEEDSASSGLQPQADELGRPHSTHPEVILALRPAEDILADVTTYPTPVQDTVSGLIASETYPLDQQDEVNSRAASTLKSSSSQRTVDFVPQRFAENTASSPPTLTKEDPNIQHETIWLPYSRHPARTSEQKQQSNGPTSTAVDPPPTALEQQVSSRLTTPYSGPDTDILAFQNSHVIKTKPRFNCEKCSEPLTGQFVKIPPRNQRFHLECFTCAVSIRVLFSTCFETDSTPGLRSNCRQQVFPSPGQDHRRKVPLDSRSTRKSYTTDTFMRRRLLPASRPYLPFMRQSTQRKLHKCNEQQISR